MSTLQQERWITQADYAKRLRSLLPASAFLPSPHKLWILLLNLAIIGLGWGIADHLPQWRWYLLWLYLPLTLGMGNSVIVLLFATHDLLHSKVIKTPLLRKVISLLGLTLLWTPPTFWKAVHNREHHAKTNSQHDPDRNYLAEQPASWGKWIQNLFVPSAEVHPFWLVIGIGFAWGVHTFRNLSAVLLFNHAQTTYAAAPIQVSAKERRAIAGEFLIILTIHLGILSYLGLHPIKLLLSYFLPIWLGYSGVMFYVYTNHMLCRMTEVNDPLINSVSIRVPQLLDLLHFNFSYHTEHHLFPGLNSDYYPELQVLLKAEYPDRFNLLPAKTAWQMLLQTPRHYQTVNSFTDWTGSKSVVCPLSSSEPL